MNVRIIYHPAYLPEMNLDYPQSEPAERIYFDVSRIADRAGLSSVSKKGNTPTRVTRKAVRLEYVLCGFIAKEEGYPLYRFSQEV